MACLIATAVVAVTMTQAGCGSGSSGETGSTSTKASAEDRAARLAAQIQLRNAQTAQESYYSQNQKYAPSIDALRKGNATVSLKVGIISGDQTGYEMRVTANDSDSTVYIIRKSGPDIERVDGNGNPW
ncbi:MAG: hypothetical protein M1455_11555 [Actinobacteria bacterium]|nr:hypothetical protein [Actinomycetota bacterium]